MGKNGDKSKKSGTLRFSLAICILIAFALGAGNLHAQNQPSWGHHRPAFKLVPASPPPGYVPPVVASLRLRPGNSNEVYWIKATEDGYAVNTCPTRLTISVGSPGRRKRIFDYKSCDWLQYVLPGGNGSAVITVWQTGSAFMTRVFRLSADHASIQLERGTHLPPEFTLDGILLNKGWVSTHGRCCTASKTEIWIWTGIKYKLVATVPFDQRYDALGKLEHESGGAK